MKPYSSEAQRRWAHTPAGKKALGGKKAVRHWDKESKGKDLPEKIEKALPLEDLQAQGYKFRPYNNNPDYHVIRVFHGKKKVGHIAYRKQAHSNQNDPQYGYHPVHVGHLEQEHQGKGLYQHAIKMAGDHVKKLGSKGVYSEGYQRSKAATRAWDKVATHAVPWTHNAKVAKKPSAEDSDYFLAASELRKNRVANTILAGLLGAGSPQVSAEAPKAQVATQQKPAHDPFHQRMLSTIAQVESSGGRQTAHVPLPKEGLHRGTRAFGKYGLTPIVIQETIKRSPNLSRNHPELGKLPIHQINEYMKKHPGLEDKIAGRHLTRLRQHFGDNPEKIGYAWLNGITGAKRAIKQNKPIQEHWHVKKIKGAFDKFKSGVKKSALQKMSRPRITFPGFPDITTRPDQEIQQIESEGQKKLFARKVAQAKLPDAKDVRRTQATQKPDGTLEFKELPPGTISRQESRDKEAKSISRFLNKPLGVVYHTRRGPQGAAFAGKMYKPDVYIPEVSEANAAHEAKMREHLDKRNQIVRDYNNSIMEWRKKGFELSRDPSKTKELEEHIARKPEKPKLPRAPSKPRKTTKGPEPKLSRETIAERGRGSLSTTEHEGLHYLIDKVRTGYGPRAAKDVLERLVGAHDKEALSHLSSFLTNKMRYNRRDPSFKEELIAHARDILVNPAKRESFKKYIGSDNADKVIAALKAGHQRAFEVARNLKPSDIGAERQTGQPEIKLAASEESRIKQSVPSWKLPQKPPKRKVTQKWVEAEPFPLEETSAEAVAPVEKGARGDWEKEGYKISHSISLNSKVDEKNDWDDYDHTITIFAHDKNNNLVGKAPFFFHPRRSSMVPTGTKVHKDHRRKGLATAMYSHAEKIMKKPILSDNPGGRTQDAEYFWSQPNRPFGKSLYKGAARRLYGKLDPLKLPDREKVKEWQTSTGFIQDLDSLYDDEAHQAVREDLPAMDPGTRLRALNKLSSRTLTRKHPETGERQFLLFRGIGEDEFHTITGPHIHNPSSHSSWTPKLDIARGFESDRQKDSYPEKESGAKTIAAWVNESDIHHSPIMYGNIPDLKMDMDNAGEFYVPHKRLKGQNEFHMEHEIVVKPHKSMRATKEDVNRYKALHIPGRKAVSMSDPKKDLHARINYRGEQDRLGFKSTKQYPLVRETKPLPSAALEAAGFGMKKPKKMAASELAKNESADQETAKIKENKKTPEAQKPHKFKPAKWTHPNGHPRCLICGDEERIGGMCEGLKNE